MSHSCSRTVLPSIMLIFVLKSHPTVGFIVGSNLLKQYCVSMLVLPTFG